MRSNRWVGGLGLRVGEIMCKIQGSFCFVDMEKKTVVFGWVKKVDFRRRRKVMNGLFMELKVNLVHYGSVGSFETRRTL